MSRSDALVRLHGWRVGGRAVRALVRAAGYSRRRRPLTQHQAGIRHGWRSGLEGALAGQLAEAGVSYSYEPEKIRFTQPAKDRTYTPDFVVRKKRSPGSFIIEGKGLWTREDRLKFRYILDCNPDLDIRFVFSNARARISKRSATTYAQWCERELKCKWAHKTIPQEWLDE